MLSAEQCRAARAWLNWSQEELAKAAEVALSTVRDFERGGREPIGHNIQAIERALSNGGIHFESGPHSLRGIKYDPRIKEADTYFHILRILDNEPGGFMKTSELIKALEADMKAGPEPNAALAGRQDARFSQIVRNVVHYRTTPKNLIGDGLAKYDKSKRGLRITDEGRRALVEEEERRQGALATPAL